MIILVSGSSGYVGSFLIKVLKEKYKVIGIDLNESQNTDIQCNISKINLTNIIKNHQVIVINLASAKQDHDFKAKEYYKFNVSDHEKFLVNLEKINCIGFIHISSVASIDGQNIEFNENLNCDDSYRATKYLQNKMIEEWCNKRNIRFVQLLPSAIFDEIPRDFTNIGRLQSMISFLPFVPDIKVKKSLTSMPKFIKFLVHFIETNKSGNFITIEQPVKTVTEIINSRFKKPRLIIKIPFLKNILLFFSTICLLIWKLFKIDLKLFPSRVHKLFRNTSYENIKNIDKNEYKKIE